MYYYRSKNTYARYALSQLKHPNLDKEPILQPLQNGVKPEFLEESHDCTHDKQQERPDYMAKLVRCSQRSINIHKYMRLLGSSKFPARARSITYRMKS